MYFLLTVEASGWHWWQKKNCCQSDPIYASAQSSGEEFMKTEEMDMEPAPDYKFRMIKGKVNDLAYAQALFHEALRLILDGEEAGLHTLHELISNTFGYENFAAKVHKPPETLRRMLSANGNPTFKNLMAILSSIRKMLNVQLQVSVIPAWKARDMICRDSTPE
jgi:DNA-binding phage protein